MNNALTLRQQASLWAILTKTEPGIASKLVEIYLPKKTPLQTDLSKISQYFQAFCIEQNIVPDHYKGALYKSSKINQRRLFIAVMVQMYGDAWGLATIISNTLCQHRPATSKMIGEVSMAYKTNDDFMEAVDRLVEKLKGGSI